MGIWGGVGLILGSNYVGMCVSKSEGHGPFFRLRVSDMSENIISLKMGLKLAVSLHIDKNLCRILYIITYKYSGNELQST